MSLSNKGESIGEALVTFLLVSISTIILLGSISTSNVIIEKSKLIDNSISDERKEIISFFNESSFDFEERILNVNVDGVQAYNGIVSFKKTNINNFIGFKK